MKKYNIAIGVNADKEMQCAGISNEESIKQIKKAGFRKVFISWIYNSWGEEQERIYNLIKANGLEIIFAHVGYKDFYIFNKLWDEGEEGDKLVDSLVKDLEILKNHNINSAVVHLHTNDRVVISEIGLIRWKKIIKEAERIGIVVAIENLRYVDLLEYLIDNIPSENLKICYDAGHDHCHSKDTFNFEMYGEKIVLNHLHDNDGTKDLHLIPYHGDIDWDRTLKNLKNCNKNLTLTAEVYYRFGYKICSPRKFYKQVFKTMKKLYKKYQQI